jgi:hypothetical protein
VAKNNNIGFGEKKDNFRWKSPKISPKIAIIFIPLTRIFLGYLVFRLDVVNLFNFLDVIDFVLGSI